MSGSDEYTFQIPESVKKQLDINNVDSVTGFSTGTHHGTGVMSSVIRYLAALLITSLVYYRLSVTLGTAISGGWYFLIYLLVYMLVYYSF